MPFIEVKTPMKFNDEQFSLMQVQLMDIVSEELDKGMDTIMVGIKDKYRLSIGQRIIQKGAYIEIKAFKESPKEAKEIVCKRINEMLVRDFSFTLDSIYITFADKNVWGYKGQFLS